MQTQSIRRLMTALALGVLLAAVIAPVGLTRTRAQERASWLDQYAPALLPQFQDDMLARQSDPRYTIDMTIALTPQAITIDGQQSVIYTNQLTDITLQDIVFRLYPNLPSYGAEMTVSNVTVDGTAVEPTLDALQTVLDIPLPAPLAPGDSASVAMDYQISTTPGELQLYGQFSYLDNILALPDAYPVLSVYEPDSGWWTVTDHSQGDAVYSQTAFYDVHVTAPVDMQLGASGSEIETTTNDDETLTHHYVAPLMRDFALIGSALYASISGEQNGVTINVYFTPDLANAMQGAQTVLAAAQESVQVFDQDFGAYPFAELDIMETPTEAGGIEYPGLIVVARSLWEQGAQALEFVTVHEAAHQWWYSLVGDDQTLDPWMDEALAQYSTAVYAHETSGERGYEAVIDNFRAEYEGYVRTHPEQPIGEPAAAYTGNAYYYYVYQKGPVFFATLADQVGYDEMLAMLQQYFDTYRYGIAEPQDMLNSFEQTSGQPLDSLFETWVGDVPAG